MVTLKGFLEIFMLKGEKRSMKHIRFETEEMLASLQTLVEIHAQKLQTLEGAAAGWERKDIATVAPQLHAFREQIVRASEHKSHIESKSLELVDYLAGLIAQERIIDHKRLEMRMRTQYQEARELCIALAHALVQQAIFIQDETPKLFSKRIAQLVYFVREEEAIYERLRALLQSTLVENQNIREKLKHERYVEEEYEKVSDSNYPQVRDNLN
jgi:hypothetical protein